MCTSIRSPWPTPFRLAGFAGLLLSTLIVIGCQAPPPDKGASNSNGTTAAQTSGQTTARAPANSNFPIQLADFTDPLRTTLTTGAAALRGARNETVTFAVQLSRFPVSRPNRPALLRLSALRQSESAAIEPAGFTAYQVLSMPVDAKRAGFVRHTGLEVSSHRLPRALVPLPLANGELPLTALRAADDTLVWFDLPIPPAVAAGEYRGTLELIDNNKPLASIPITLTVDDFVLPDERHLAMVGLVDFEALTRLYPQQFTEVRPHLLSRTDPRTAAAVSVLDEIIKLTQSHRLQVIVPGLHPVVKWPTGQPPAVDWTDYDGVVSPWLRGDAFPDAVPLMYWPLPWAENLEFHAQDDRNAYWRNAAAHFDQNNWLGRAGVSIERTNTGRVRIEETVELSEQAAHMLFQHPGLRVALPLEEDQVQLATPQAIRRIDPATLDRVSYVAPGLVSTPPLQRLPRNSGATRWLRTDVEGLVPYAGAGAHDREMRLWAWLAFLRDATLIRWPSVLPSQSSPTEPASPDELIWFYPGSWFGLDKPVPTIHLKYLRRAQYDYEYLWLAKQRGQGERAAVLARLLSKPVELHPAQAPDAVHGLLSGTADPVAWTRALDLLSRSILLSQPGQAVDPTAESQLRFETISWIKSLDRPILLARSVDWAPGLSPNLLDVRLTLEIYNTAEQPPENSRLEWGAMPEAWQSLGSGTPVPPQLPYSVARFPLQARLDLDRLDNAAPRKPVTLRYVESDANTPFQLQAMLPAAWCERRQGAAPRLNGRLDDWHALDAMHNGPLVQMLSRPTVQRQELRPATTNSTLLSCFTPANLYLGFRVDGIDPNPPSTNRNYASFEFRRAWNEDVCEALLQPLYADGSAGPLFHLVVKPRGQLSVQRRLDPRMNANPWQAFTSSGFLYESHVDPNAPTTWRGELQIPWDDLNDPAHAGQRPTLLRFNFSQHRATTGESTSWAGPVDYAMDEGFTGLLQVRRADPLDMLQPRR